METAAPGITAPVESVTIPLIEPEFAWACSGGSVAEIARANREKRMLRLNGRMEGPPENRCCEEHCPGDFPMGNRRQRLRFVSPWREKHGRRSTATLLGIGN